MKGEPWLDTATGLPTRRFAYFVKSPSAWIRRVIVAQEDCEFPVRMRE
jgi:hypothetical protein